MKKRILYHILFWLTYLVWSGYVAGSYDGNFKRSFITDLFHLPIKIIVTYFIMYFVLPRYMKTKKYGEQFLVFSVLVLISAFVFRFTIYKIIQPWLYPESEFHFWNYPRLLWGVFEVFSIAAVAVSLKLYKIKNQNIQQVQELEKEKLKTELSFLKAQINPHFLFNTLNNIYGLSLKNSPQTSESILKLSGLLHFMVHDGSAEKIKLTDEINSINDYIALEKLRYGNRLNIIFETEIDDEREQIAPMILLSFVENSFKHGASESRHQSFIRINISLKEGQLKFVITNSKEQDQVTEPGIGLKNSRRQLELIYGKNHQLEIINLADKYSVTLKIDLKEHAKTQLFNY